MKVDIIVMYDKDSRNDRPMCCKAYVAENVPYELAKHLSKTIAANWRSFLEFPAKAYCVQILSAEDRCVIDLNDNVDCH